MIENRDFFGGSIQGSRVRQEDAWDYIQSPTTGEGNAKLLAVVADGLGGEHAGHIASNLAVEVFTSDFQSCSASASQQLNTVVHRANDRIRNAISNNHDFEGMGTTVVAAVCFENRIEWLSVGDSFLLRFRDNELELINPLHTYGALLDKRVELGEISEREAMSHPDRDLLTSALLGEELVEIATGEFEVRTNDLLLLASDGILTLSVKELERACARYEKKPAELFVKGLLQSVENAARDSQDNTTVLAIRCEGLSVTDDASPNKRTTSSKFETSVWRRILPWR